MRPARQAPQRSVIPWFLVITAAAMVIRLIYVLQARAHDPLFFAPQMDAEYHYRWALAIAAGKEFIRDAFFRAPLYPYFLGSLYRLGLDLFQVRLVQAALGSASCGLLYLLARRILCRVAREDQRAEPGATKSVERAARVSGLVFAAYPLAIYFDAELLLPPLLVFLVLLGFVLLYQTADSDRRWWLPGIVFGLAVITRPNVLVFLPLLGIWLLLRFRRGAWLRFGLFAGAVGLVILPVTVRNYVVSRTFVPIAWQAGTNFYIGNNPHSDGVTAIVPGTRGSWWGGFYDVKRLAEQAMGRELTGAEIDRYWLGKGFEFWRNDPGRAFALTLRKAYLLLSGYEVSNNRNIYYFKRFTFINLFLFRSLFLKFPFGLLLPLALAGVYLSRRNSRRWSLVYLFLVGYGASFVLFFITARYRMPLVPFLIVLAVYGFFRFLSAVRKEKLVTLAIFAFTFLLFNAGTALIGGFGSGRIEDPAQTRLTSATGLYGQHKLEPALVEVRAALAYDSAENALVLESTILLDMNRVGAAREAARAAVRRYPQSPEPLGQLGNVYGRSGQLDSAQACFERVRKLDPYSVSALTNLGNIALARGDYAQARSHFEKVLEIEPTFVTVLFNLGLLDWQEGSHEQARQRWRQVLALDPSHAKARQALDHFR